ncbi:MAG: two-component system, NtrC family, sensor histidine kinase HydH, partial [Verrucomicrobiota bacterium]
MELTRRSLLVYGLLLAVWALVVLWQGEEHLRVRESAKTDLRNRSKDIANTLSAFIRGLRFRGTGAITQDRLEPVLNELVNGRTNELVKSSELISIVLLNAAGEPVASAGKPIDVEQKDIAQEGERWGHHSVTLVNPVDLGASLASEGATNPTVILPAPPPRDPANTNRDNGRATPRRETRPEDAGSSNALNSIAANITNGAATNAVARTERDRRPRGRPPWLRSMDEKEYQALLEKRALHGLVLAMSTESLQAAWTHDLWLRSIIVILATISVLGSGLAWRNLAKSSDLQLRLVRASEMNTHLKEMNLAAAGLAHETRNPLNII